MKILSMAVFALTAVMALSVTDAEARGMSGYAKHKAGKGAGLLGALGTWGGYDAKKDVHRAPKNIGKLPVKSYAIIPGQPNATMPMKTMTHIDH